MDDAKTRRRLERQERLERALRENLRRRKAQARSRAAQQEPSEAESEPRENAPVAPPSRERR